jgi:hypothetical protein
VLLDPDLLSRIKKECGGLDIEKDFETHFGITLMGWLSLNQAQIDNFFDMLSSSFEELPAEIRKERKVDGRFDLVPFKSKPFFEASPDTYACVDFGLLTEKLHNGPYFLLSNKLPTDERWKVFNAWGLCSKLM